MPRPPRRLAARSSAPAAGARPCRGRETEGPGPGAALRDVDLGLADADGPEPSVPNSFRLELPMQAAPWTGGSGGAAPRFFAKPEVRRAPLPMPAALPEAPGESRPALLGPPFLRSLRVRSGPPATEPLDRNIYDCLSESLRRDLQARFPLSGGLPKGRAPSPALLESISPLRPPAPERWSRVPMTPGVPLTAAEAGDGLSLVSAVEAGTGKIACPESQLPKSAGTADAEARPGRGRLVLWGPQPLPYQPEPEPGQEHDAAAEAAAARSVAPTQSASVPVDSAASFGPVGNAAQGGRPHSPRACGAPDDWPVDSLFHGEDDASSRTSSPFASRQASRGTRQPPIARPLVPRARPLPPRSALRQGGLESTARIDGDARAAGSRPRSVSIGSTDILEYTVGEASARIERWSSAILASGLEEDSVQIRVARRPGHFHPHISRNKTGFTVAWGEDDTLTTADFSHLVTEAVERWAAEQRAKVEGFPAECPGARVCGHPGRDRRQHALARTLFREVDETARSPRRGHSGDGGSSEGRFLVQQGTFAIFALAVHGLDDELEPFSDSALEARDGCRVVCHAAVRRYVPRPSRCNIQ